MDALFWQRMHGGSTHFPIVLLLASIIFDGIACWSHDEGLRRGLHQAGFGSAMVGVLGGCGAVVSGLVMTGGQMMGEGLERMHHLFVWPAFGIYTVLVAWRWFRRKKTSPFGLRLYLVGMAVASALMMGAGFWGGEMLLGAEMKSSSTPDAFAAAAETAAVTRGHDLFLLNCAHCHGDDGLGSDEAPNLATRGVSNARIAFVINNGIKGQMPRFNQKLQDQDVQLLIHFVRSLKPEGGRSETTASSR